MNQLVQKPLTVVQWSPGHLPKPLVTFNPITQYTTINGKATSGPTSMALRISGHRAL